MKKLRVIIKKEDGFALVEVAIALIVMGIILGVGLPSFLHYLQWQKVRDTKEKQDKILYSVSSFALQNGFIPLPADPYAAGDQFGQARQSLSSSHDLRGIVPFKTLGLSEDAARDGFKNYFTYIGGATGKEDADLPNLSSVCRSEPFSPLTVDERRPDGSLSKRSLDLSARDPLVLILISHGESGHGAYYGIEGSIKQMRQPTHMAEDKRHNAAHGTHIISRAPSKKPGDLFDDMVVWTSRSNLMAFYGKTPCGSEERPIGPGHVFL